jgi:hypothetical protein
MLRRSRSQQAHSERNCAHHGVVQDLLDEEIASGGAHRRLSLSSLPHHDVLRHIEDLDEQKGVRGSRAGVATSAPDGQQLNPSHHEGVGAYGPRKRAQPSE